MHRVDEAIDKYHPDVVYFDHGLHGHRNRRLRPKQSGAGKIEIQVDGQSNASVDLSTTGSRQPQQLVAQVTG